MNPGHASDKIRAISASADVLELVLLGDPSGAQRGEMIAMMMGMMAVCAALGGPAITALAVLKNMRALIPSPTSTLVVMGAGFTFAGVAAGALLGGLAWWMAEGAKASQPGTLKIERRADGGATLTRTGRAGAVLWTGQVEALSALKVQGRELSTKTANHGEVFLVRADGRPLGPARGARLASFDRDPAAAIQLGAAIDAALTAFAKL
jgi:hypothetical protein